MPNLSVVTPSFNHGRFIDDCVCSVRGQRPQAIEHIILDDGSTDDTVERLSRFPHLTVLQQENRGLASTLQTLIERASGDWIGWLNSDDFYLQTAFSHFTNALRANPAAGLIVGDTVWVDERARSQRLLGAHRFNRTVARRYLQVPYVNCSYFIRRDIALQAGIEQDTKFLMDKFLLWRLAERGVRAVLVRDAIGAMRRYVEQTSNVFAGESGASERARFDSAANIPESGAPLRLSRSAGRAAHVALKVVDGAYRREQNFRTRRGTDCRWWR